MIIAEMQLENMERIIKTFRSKYLEKQQLYLLAFAIRAWLPFVSYTPFIILKDAFDINHWEAVLPEGSNLNSTIVDRTTTDIDEILRAYERQTGGVDLAALDEDQLESIDFKILWDILVTYNVKIPIEIPGERLLDEDMDWRVDSGWEGEEAPQTFELRVPESHELGDIKSWLLEQLKRLRWLIRGEGYVKWREGSVDQLRDDSPRKLALNSLSLTNPQELKKRLYETDPILLIIPKLKTKPKELVKILRMEVADRDEELKQLVEQITNGLTETKDSFKEQINRESEDLDWDRFRPLLEAAKYALFPKDPKTGPLHGLADEVAEDLKPWTIQDTVKAIVTALSVILFVASLGAATPVVAYAIALSTIALDVGAVGFDTYMNYRENLEREELNRFAHIDAALAVAGPQTDLKKEAIFLAISYAIGPALGAGFRGSKNVLQRLAVRFKKAGEASQGARAASQTGKEVDRAIGQAERAVAKTEARAGRGVETTAVTRSAREGLELGFEKSSK